MKTDVLLLTGYLGAGKTTFISGMLSRSGGLGKKTAVLVNEFGSLPIDSALIPRQGQEVLELNNGSIFCVCVQAGLLKALERIAFEIRPEILLVEATGLAAPKDLSAILCTERLRDSFGRYSVLTLVDALNFPKLSKILPVLSEQVRAANIILVNKADLADEKSLASIEESVRRLNPSAKMLRTVFSRWEGNLEELFDRSWCQNKNAPGLSLCESAPKSTRSCEFRTDAVLDKEKFLGAVGKYARNIIRAKGVADFGDERVFLEVIGGRIQSRPADEVSFRPEQRTAMVFITLNLKAETLLDALSSAETA